MKLHHLLQKCSFFLIKLAVFLASGAACMKILIFYPLAILFSAIIYDAKIMQKSEH